MDPVVDLDAARAALLEVRGRSPVIGAPALVTIDAIRAAVEVLRGVTIRSPLVPFGPPEDRRYLKAESLQPIGAFKLRGAYVSIASLPPEARATPCA